MKPKPPLDAVPPTVPKKVYDPSAGQSLEAWIAANRGPGIHLEVPESVSMKEWASAVAAAKSSSTATVKQLIAGAKLMSPRMVRRYLGEIPASKDRKILKPEKGVAKPPVTLNRALVPVKAAQTLKPDPRGRQGGSATMRRLDPVDE